MQTRGEETRAEILAVLARSRAPMSAYAILDVLKRGRQKLTPPTIYRALASLVAQGRVHRLESLNAFVACQCGEHHDDMILSICDACGRVEESLAPDVMSRLSRIAGKSGFVPERHVIELRGRCAACATAETRA